MVRMWRLVLVVAVIAAGPCSAEIRFDPRFSTAELGALADAIGDALAFPNMGPASASGVTGFELLVAGGGPRVSTSSRWWKYGVEGSTTAGVMAGGRGILRKGLPLRLDVGAQGGTLLGERFWGAEARWALLEGGVLEPGVALRASYSRLDHSGVMRVEVGEAQLVVSKGFTLLTPYVAGGYRRVEARAYFGDPQPRWWDVEAETWTAVGGVRLNLLPFRIVGEVRRGAGTSVFAGVGVGL
ncbi:MAG TPA: hypothetical protein P5234_02890 [Thermoanaerobaculaceae bacterium]|nr:hypothetical protein [Thermoanaerobaculaceae bacterium]HRS15175.1 hypothetical protein [Thermoanaerobaculaceae bacterium]